MFGPKLTDAQKAARDAEKARNKAARRLAAERAAASREALRKERFEVMPEFVVREIREVRVKAETVPDAISLAAAAFKEGQDTRNGIRWGRPFGVEGDTIEPIRVVNVKVAEG